jgi:hypothetical protein
MAYVLKEFNENIQNGMKTLKFSTMQGSSKHNFKKEVWKHTFRHKSNKECSINFVYFKEKSKDYYTKKNTQSFPT